MFYEKELDFIRMFLKNMRLNSYIVPSEDNYEDIDFRLRKLLFSKHDYSVLFDRIMSRTRENVIYRFCDSFYCNYIFIRLPDTKENTALIIGPYLEVNINKDQMLQLADKFNIDPKAFLQFEKYYQSIPLLPDDPSLFALLCSFGELIWGGSDKFSIERVSESTVYSYGEAPVYTRSISDKPQLALHLLETRYELENQLMRYVSQGLTNKVELCINSGNSEFIEQRHADGLRNIKNYTVVLNTILRKAAETGGVHPYYIDSVSSDFALKIETSNSVEDVQKLQATMMRSYCQLVKRFTMKHYSPLIQKVITAVDSEITSDLSLKAMADMLNVNPSYLSTLFKKETGFTLTDYVNKKRTDYAAHLLKTTNLQIQSVSQYCGIYDVNYFTKIFKKYTGKTPKEYRATT